MLFCKPGIKTNILYDKEDFHGQHLSLRSLVIKKDIPIIYDWLSESTFVSRPFRVPAEDFQHYYRTLLKDKDAHCYVIASDEQLVGQISIYKSSAEDLIYSDRRQEDIFVDVVLPPSAKTNVNYPAFEFFLQYFFSFEESSFLHGQPEIYNYPICRLLERCGFLFQRNVMLKSHAASLYMISRKQFEYLFGIKDRVVVK